VLIFHTLTKRLLIFRGYIYRYRLPPSLRPWLYCGATSWQV